MQLAVKKQNNVMLFKKLEANENQKIFMELNILAISKNFNLTKEMAFIYVEDLKKYGEFAIEAIKKSREITFGSREFIRFPQLSEIIDIAKIIKQEKINDDAEKKRIAKKEIFDKSKKMSKEQIDKIFYKAKFCFKGID